MPVTSVDDFLAALEKSRLLGAEPMEEARRLARQAGSPAEYAGLLVQQGLISRWHEASLLAGRTAFYLGKYKLIQLLGRGGMGSVFLAEHTTMNRRVALKIVPRQIGQDPAALQRFLAEARAIAALDHPNIVQAYSVDYESGRYFIVMEYVDGADLQRIVEQGGPLDAALAADYVRQAADGLAHAHARKLIHCDIKPSNLLVNPQGVVKILDLGLARLSGNDEDRPEDRILGTVDYQAPEQAMQGPDFDHRADIYALGCTLYFLLTGCPPFAEGTLAERIVKHQTREPRDIRDLRRDAPAELVAICRKMMAKDPASRYQSADDVAKALSLWQNTARQPIRSLAVKIAAPPEEEVPAASLAGSAWLDFLSSPPNGSGRMRAVRLGEEGQAGPASPRSAEAPHGKPLAWLKTSRGKIIAAGSLCVVVLAAAIAGAVWRMATRPTPADASHTETQAKSPEKPPESKSLPEEKSLIIEPSLAIPPLNEKPSKTTELKTEKPPQEKPQEKPEEKPQAKPQAKPEEKPQAKPEAKPKEKPEEKVKPEIKPEIKPETKVVKPEVKPGPEAKGDPKVAKTEPASQDRGPFGKLPAAVRLPPLGDEAESPEKPASLATIHLDAPQSLAVQMLSRPMGAKGLRFVVHPDRAGAGGNWTVSAEVRSGNQPVDVARVWLEKQDLKFQWLAGATGIRADYLRNCGLVLETGDEQRFLPLRVAEEVAPLALTLDVTTGKSSSTASFSDRSLPEPKALALHLSPLRAPFPNHQLKFSGRAKSADAIPSGSRVDIFFTDSQLSSYAIRLTFECKGPEVTVAALPMYSTTNFSWYVMQKRLKSREAYVPFAIGDAVGIRRSLAAREDEAKSLAGSSKNDQEKKAAEAAAKMCQAQLKQLEAFREALKNAAVQFRVFIPLDEEHQVDVLRSKSPAGQEVAKSAKTD